MSRFLEELDRSGFIDGLYKYSDSQFPQISTAAVKQRFGLALISILPPEAFTAPTSGLLTVA